MRTSKGYFIICIFSKQKTKDKSPTKKWNPQIERTKISSLAGIHSALFYMETQLYKDKLNYFMSPSASQSKKLQNKTL